MEFRVVYTYVLLITVCVHHSLNLRCNEYVHPHLLINGRCYIWIKHRFLTFSAAQTECSSGLLGYIGSLAQPRDFDELQAISAMIQNAGAKFVEIAAPWVGIQRSGACSTPAYDALQFLNTTGLGPAASTSWWNPGEPNACAETAVSLAEDGGLLRDESSSDKRTYICQFDEPPENPTECNTTNPSLIAQPHDNDECWVLNNGAGLASLTDQKLACADGRHGFYGSLAMVEYHNSGALAKFLHENSGTTFVTVGIERQPNLEGGWAAQTKDGWMYADERFVDRSGTITSGAMAFDDGRTAVAALHGNGNIYDQHLPGTRWFMCQYDLTTYPDACLNATHFLANGNTCYHMHMDPWFTWWEARKHCEQGTFNRGYSGYLAMPDTTAAWNAMNALMAQINMAGYGEMTSIGMYRATPACYWRRHDNIYYMDGRKANGSVAPFRYDEPGGCGVFGVTMEPPNDWLSVRTVGSSEKYVCNFKLGCAKPSVPDPCPAKAPILTYKSHKDTEVTGAQLGMDIIDVRFQGQCGILCSGNCGCRAYTFFKDTRNCRLHWAGDGHHCITKKTLFYKFLDNNILSFQCKTEEENETACSLIHMYF